MQLPKTPETDKTGDLAVSLCQVAFEKRDCKFRRQDGRNDFGIDAEIEIVEKNSVTGRILKAQIKGNAEIDWAKNGYVLVPVSVSTYNLWKSLPVPVIALLCDIKSEAIYWSLPLARVPKKSADSISLRFEKDQCLRTSFDLLLSFLRSWFQAFSQENILREVPYFYGVFNDLSGLVGWGDAWSMLVEEDDSKCRLFYNHVIQLRLRLGLSCTELPALDEWYIRSAAVWGDTPHLFYGTFDEFFLYTKPYYEEVFALLRDRVANANSYFENQELRNLFEKLDGKLPVTFLDPRMENQQFARDFDRRLEKRGLLKYRQEKE
jgi:uncharacterized protein DUF4365